MTQRHNPEFEEVIIQGLNNRERRSILKIVNLATEGAIYSDILAELSLNSGSLNYHLRQLEGLIAKNIRGRYILTPLGQKALNALYSINEGNGKEKDYEEFIIKARASQKRTPYLILAGIFTAFSSCTACVIGTFGILTLLFTLGIQSLFGKWIAWLFITGFAMTCSVLGLKAALFVFRRIRFGFSVTTVSLLLIPAVASTIVFAGGNSLSSFGGLFTLAIELPMIVSLAFSLIFILISKNEFHGV